MFPTNKAGLLSKLEAVEGTLFLHQSVLQRNCQTIEPEIERLVENHQSASASFALKRLKLNQALLEQIEIQLEQLDEATKNVELSQKKKNSLKILSNTYALLRDIAFVMKLDDALLKDEDDDLSKEAFTPLFEKYGVNPAEVLEMIFTMDTQFALTESVCIEKRSIPNFLSSTELPNICEAGC